MLIQEANRLQNIHEYYFSVKLRQIAEINKAGLNVINIGIGSPDMNPPDVAIAALIETAQKKGIHGYQGYKGTNEFREGIVSWYKRIYKVDLNAETEILPLIGSKEGIAHISLAFINENDKVLVPDPGYPTYTSVSNLVGAQVITYDLSEENNWEIDLNQIVQLADEGIRMMWINYPHMPTGINANETVISKLIKIAQEKKFLIVNDNPYSTILTNHHFSIFKLAGAKEVCLELNSLSKSHNMAGWRLGWVAGDASYINSILKVKSNMDSGMFLGLQNAAAAALKMDAEWIKSVNDEYKKRRKIVWKILLSLGCTFSKEQSGLFVWGKIPPAFTNGNEYADKILREAHVFITPGFIFGKNGDQYLRVSLCSNTAILAESLKRIESRTCGIKTNRIKI